MSDQGNIAGSPESAMNDKQGITTWLERRAGLAIEDASSVDLTATAH